MFSPKILKAKTSTFKKAMKTYILNLQHAIGREIHSKSLVGFI